MRGVAPRNDRGVKFGRRPALKVISNHLIESTEECGQLTRVVLAAENTLGEGVEVVDGRETRLHANTGSTGVEELE